MTTIDRPNINLEIAQEEKRLNAIETARKERLNQERRELQEIEASKQRLAALYRQQAQDAFDEALRQNAGAVAANNEDVAKLFGVLDGLQQAITEGIPFYKQVEESFAQQQNIHNRALNAANGLLTEQPIVEDDRLFESQARASAREQRGYEAQIKPALTLAFAVFKWVTQGKGEKEIRFRQGIGYALTGSTYTFDANNPPTDESLRQQISNQYSRVSLG
jgi:flagellar biosynthesis GTPase FlhF